MKRKTKQQLKAEKANPSTPPAELQTFPDRVVPECVTLAKKLLADCEAGRVKAFAVATVNQSDMTSSASALPPNNPMQAHLLCAAVSKMNFAFTRAIVGG